MSDPMTPDDARDSDRDWVFARRFVVRRMIERGDPTAADRIPDIPEVGESQEVIEALLERFFWERVDTLARLVWPNKKNREPFQASGFRIALDDEPRPPHEHRALHLSYHGATVSAGLPDALADYMERERPFHRFLGLDGAP